MRQARDDLTLSSHCHDLYELCLKNADRKAQPGAWMRCWVRPLFASPASFGLARLQKLAMERDPEAMKVALEVSEADWKASSSEEIAQNLKVALVAARLKKSKEGSKWGDAYLDLPAFKTALRFFTDAVRLDAFETVIASKSSNEPFTAGELSTCLELFRSNSGLEDTADRQNFLMLVKKFFVRLSDSVDASSRHAVGEEAARRCLDFVSELVGFLVSLLPSEENSSRTYAVESLLLFVRFFEGQKQFLDLLLSDKASAEVLLTFLREDTYDKNCASALSILKQFDRSCLALNREQVWADLEDACRSINPARSASASNLLLLSLDSEGTSEEAIEKLLLLARRQLKVAEVDLQKAANEGPMYGALLCLRAVLASIPRKEAVERLRPFVGRLLDLCFSTSEAVAPVLTSETPEGLSLGSDDDGEAQKLLLCTWRSSKEVSLILGEMIHLLPAEVKCLDGSGCLLTLSEVDSVSQFFMKQLEQVKHRGAFEQAYVGFCALCSFMWVSEDLRMRERLLSLLRETLSNVRSQDASLCVTRRSAGVPFLIQGVVSTEPDVSQRSEVFSETMQTLLACCELEKEGEEDSGLEVRVHAMNILRAMVRNNKLGEKIAPFLERTIVAALRGFKSAVWAVSEEKLLFSRSIVSKVSQKFVSLPKIHISSFQKFQKYFLAIVICFLFHSLFNF